MSSIELLQVVAVGRRLWDLGLVRYVDLMWCLGAMRRLRRGIGRIDMVVAGSVTG